MGVNPCVFVGEDQTMDGLASVWGYQENVEDLKQRLLYTTLELESLRASTKEEMVRKEEYANQLIQLLNLTKQERDEARDQLQLLVKKVMQPTPGELSPIPCYLQPESPQMRQRKGNASITDSDSLSGTPNHQSYVSSPVESFFDAATSPELSNINMPDSCNMAIVPHRPLFQDFSSTNNGCSPPVIPNYDAASAYIDQYANKKPLPEKGKLVEAVMSAGPLLQNLLVAGALPRWRNPPPLQPFQIPPVAVKGRSVQTINHVASSNPNSLVQSSTVGLQQEKGCTPPQLGFPGVGGFCIAKSAMMVPFVSSFSGLAAKRQKSQ